MRQRYVLAPTAARDLARIWRYLKKQSGEETANRVESVIRSKFLLLSETPGLGHLRLDLTSQPVKFFPAYSYLIVYRPETKPLQIVTIVHGSRDVALLLDERF